MVRAVLSVSLSEAPTRRPSDEQMSAALPDLRPPACLARARLCQSAADAHHSQTAKPLRSPADALLRRQKADASGE